MKRLAQGAIKFKKEIFETHREFFEPLANAQHPMALMFTCCDSRVEPSLITQSSPGTLFLVKNIGNVVPVYDPDGPHFSEAAAIEYALESLNVHHIIVCGHTDCGAMKALQKLDALPKDSAVYEWLYPQHHLVDLVKHTRDPDEQLNELIRRNVVQQLHNLTTYPSVVEKLEAGNLHLYGWKYRLASGEMMMIDGVSCRPEPLSRMLPNLIEEERLDGELDLS